MVGKSKLNSANRLKERKRRLRNVSNLIYLVSRIVFKIPNSIGKIRAINDLACNLMIPISEAMNDESNCYVTYNLVPQYADVQNDWLYYSGMLAKECCIVIQGALVKKNDFTLETVKYYGRIYPDVIVVISTWENEDKGYIEKLKKEKNCVIILNKIPTISGASNVNYQILSSLNGAKKAAALGKKYVLKTRSDMRITACGVFDMLCQYVNQYKISTTVKKQQQRLVLFNAFLFHPYHTSDFFCFGKCQDVISYYDIELSKAVKEDDIADRMVADLWNYRDLYNNPCGENYICKKYFAKLNGATTCNLHEWWSVLATYVIALPLHVLRPLWIKYDYNHEENNFYMTYRRQMLGGDKIDNTTVEFGMWLDMCEGRFCLDSRDYEYIVDIPMS